MPIIHRFVDGENAHLIAVKMAKYGILISSKKTRVEYSILNCSVFDQKFNNPIGNSFLI